jgi:NADH pyrophosphatase NudC (nudix superfamily)
MQLYQYCPHCGCQYDEPGQAILSCSNCNKQVFLSSAPTVSVLIEKDGKVLLGRRGLEPAKGKWCQIGGFLDYGEAPIHGAIREAKEESGLDIEVGEYIDTYMGEYGPEAKSTLNLCFMATVKGGSLRLNSEVTEFGWFGRDELPADLAFSNTEQLLLAWKARG